jgi:hypothetical protein
MIAAAGHLIVAAQELPPQQELLCEKFTEISTDCESSLL